MELYLGEAYATLQAQRKLPSIDEQVETMRTWDALDYHHSSCLIHRCLIDGMMGFCIKCEPNRMD